MEMFVDSEYVQVPLQEAAVVSAGDIAAEEEVTTEEDNNKVSNEDVLNRIQTILDWSHVVKFVTLFARGEL